MGQTLKERIQSVLVQDYDGVWESFVADHGREDRSAFVRHLVEWDLIPASLGDELLADLADEPQDETAIMEGQLEVDEDATTRQWNREDIVSHADLVEIGTATDPADPGDPGDPGDGDDDELLTEEYAQPAKRPIAEPGVEIDPEAETMHIDRRVLTPAPANRTVAPAPSAPSTPVPPPPPERRRPPPVPDSPTSGLHDVVDAVAPSEPRGSQAAVAEAAPVSASSRPDSVAVAVARSGRPGQRTPEAASRARPAPSGQGSVLPSGSGPAVNRSPGSNPPAPPRTTPGPARSTGLPAPSRSATPAPGRVRAPSLPPGPLVDDARFQRAPDGPFSERDASGRALLVHALSDEQLQDSWQIERFERELRMLLQLDHPGIPAVVEVRGPHAYTVRAHDGRPLSSVLAEVRASYEARRAVPASLEPVVLLERFARACEIVAYAHSRGVVHRDLNPNNILLGDFGGVWVTGWGGARVFDRTAPNPVADDAPDESSRTLTGTPGYCSPEQANGRNRDLDARSEVYTLGLVLFELLTLKPAVTGASPSLRLARQQQAQVDPLTHFYRQRIEPVYGAILATALAVHPADRYASPTTLAEDVRRAVRGAPLSGRSERFRMAIGRVIGRHPTAVFLVVVALLTAWATTFFALLAQITGQLAG